jgi:hypothetical protein
MKEPVDLHTDLSTPIQTIQEVACAYELNHGEIAVIRNDMVH